MDGPRTSRSSHPPNHKRHTPRAAHPICAACAIRADHTPNAAGIGVNPPQTREPCLLILRCTRRHAMSLVTATSQALAQFAPHIAGQTFDASVTLSEWLDSGEPSACWPGRSVRISRSHLILVTKRMCYSNRTLLIAVHKIDSTPLVLAGLVELCDYVGNGLNAVALSLQTVPETPQVTKWTDSFRKSARE
jgi:hypothetical protein